MITVETSRFGTVKINGVVNLGGWFGERWVIGIGCGYTTFFYLVEAGDEQSALDELTDSSHGHMIKCDPDYVKEMTEKEDALIKAFGEEKAQELMEEDDELKRWLEVDRAGNCGEPVDVEEIRYFDKAGKVNFFAKANSLD